jgi:hypothetical protein
VAREPFKTGGPLAGNFLPSTGRRELLILRLRLGGKAGPGHARHAPRFPRLGGARAWPLRYLGRVGPECPNTIIEAHSCPLGPVRGGPPGTAPEAHERIPLLAGPHTMRRKTFSGGK